MVELFSSTEETLWGSALGSVSLALGKLSGMLAVSVFSVVVVSVPPLPQAAKQIASVSTSTTAKTFFKQIASVAIRWIQNNHRMIYYTMKQIACQSFEQNISG